MKFAKKIELKVRNYFNSTFVSNNQPKLIERGELCDEFRSITKVLILRHDRIGDVLVSIPVLKTLHQNFPEIEIDILLSEKNSGTASVVQNYCNKIWILQKDFVSNFGLIKHLNKKKYDIIIDLFDNVSTRSNILLRLIKSRYKLGFDKSNRGNYTHIVLMPDKSKVHIVERIYKLLYPFGISIARDDIRLEYPIGNATIEKAYALLGRKEHKIRLGIVLSGSDEAKFWGTDNIIKFVNLMNISCKNFEFVLFGTKKNQDILYSIPQETSIKIAPFTCSLNEFAGMISICDYILSPDTSAVHFASAFSIPCLALYSVQRNSGLMPWYPYNSSYRAVITDEPSICAIKPEDVLEKFIELYEATR